MKSCLTGKSCFPFRSLRVTLFTVGATPLKPVITKRISRVWVWLPNLMLMRPSLLVLILAGWGSLACTPFGNVLGLNIASGQGTNSSEPSWSHRIAISAFVVRARLPWCQMSSVCKPGDNSLSISNGFTASLSAGWPSIKNKLHAPVRPSGTGNPVTLNFLTAKLGW